MAKPKRPIPGFVEPTAMSRPGYMNAEQAYRQFPISRRKLRGLMKVGEIPFVRNGSAKLIPLEKLYQYEQQQLRMSVNSMAQS